MDLKLVQSFLVAISIITASFLFWSHRWRRSRENPERSKHENDIHLPPLPVREDDFQYDVFLSFRGADTRKGFTSHLYEALKNKGVATFMDNETLEKGHKVEELFRYIERSKIVVPIFSKGYADSEWCLNEIAKTIECKRLILPVFFDVEPRDVRHQTGPFVPAFKKYHKNENIDKEKVSKWSRALRGAGEVSGFNLADTEGNEAKLIQLIVKWILTEVNKTSLFVAKHSVGLDSRIKDVMELLDVEAEGDARIVGIYGMGGIGKTTLATAIYNQISTHFDACSFISNVREVAKQSSGLVSLQEQLLCDVFKGENANIQSTSHGVSIIKQRIWSKKVLLVLDDLDDESQFDSLAGHLDWFCFGSRIIITTRDKGVLKLPRVKLYELKELNATQSLQLFSWHAFGTEQPVEDFAEHSKRVASIAAGLPLALTIFGSHFFDLRTINEWTAMLERLREDQDKGIHERLRISFDTLDEKEKKVFLDIACMFIGRKKEHPTLMWEGCKFFPDITIKVLIHKSLVSITDTGEFEMHDHIRDMGRKIVEEESLLNPGMCSSRLWKEDEILNVLRNKTGTRNIEAIQFFCKSAKSVSVDVESFAAMSQLRMLRLCNVTLEGEYEHFPKTLRWLEWSPKELHSLPDRFCLENIVVLDLSNSSITQVWNMQRSAVVKVCDKLKVLNLRGCHNLTICPIFTSMPHVETLDFSGCKKMSELHPSIGHLKSLTYLSLNGCESLKELHESIRHLKRLTHLSLMFCESLEKLPKEICELTSLKMLDLTCCYQIMTLPSQLGDLKSLKRLIIDSTSITTLPESMGYLKQLNHLSLRRCSLLKEIPECIFSLSNLQHLDVGECRFFAYLPNSLGNLKSLRYLDLSWTIIEELPDSIVSLTKLEAISVACCERVKFFPAPVSAEHLERQHYSLLQFPPSLTELNAAYCNVLKNIPDVSNAKGLQKLDLSGCEMLVDVPGVEKLKWLKSLKLIRCRSLCNSLWKRLQLLTREAYEAVAFVNGSKPSKGGCFTIIDMLFTEKSPDSVLQDANFQHLGEFTISERRIDGRPGFQHLDEFTISERRIDGRPGFQHLGEFTISERRIDGRPGPYPQSLSFLLPNHFTSGLLYLYVDQSSLDSIGSKSNESDNDLQPIDRVRRVVRIDIVTDDAQFVFSTSIKWNAYETFPMAIFEQDSELMRSVREGKFMRNAADDRKTMLMMRVSIDGCFLLGGDLQTTNYYDFHGICYHSPSDDHPLVKVKFG